MKNSCLSQALGREPNSEAHNGLEREGRALPSRLLLELLEAVARFDEGLRRCHEGHKIGEVGAELLHVLPNLEEDVALDLLGDADTVDRLCQ